jgi:RNase P/RNase MRP subunit POP5
MTSSSKMERTRYILVFYQYERILTEDELRKIISFQLNRLFGIKGSLEMGFFLAWIHQTETIAILRTSHSNLLKLLNVTFFITEFNNYPLSIIPIKTSGSIKSLKDVSITFNWLELKTWIRT